MIIFRLQKCKISLFVLKPAAAAAHECSQTDPQMTQSCLRTELMSVLNISPNVDLTDSLNPPLPHYNVSQSSVYISSLLCVFTSHSPSSAPLFYTTVPQFFPLCCRSVFPIQLSPPSPPWFPCERLEVICHAIKTHDHNFLTFLPLLFH